MAIIRVVQYFPQKLDDISSVQDVSIDSSTHYDIHPKAQLLAEMDKALERALSFGTVSPATPSPKAAIPDSATVNVGHRRCAGRHDCGCVPIASRRLKLYPTLSPCYLSKQLLDTVQPQSKAF